MDTLITYASEHGSTKEIAERINFVISAKTSPHETECIPIEQIADLSKYSYIVVGSAIHNMSWLPIASSFLHNNAPALSKVPVWAFSVGSPAGIPKFLKWLDAESKEQKNLADTVNKDVKTQGHVLFSGKFLREHAPPLLGWIWSSVGGQFGDFRDWNQIEAWANKVGDEIAQKQRECEN
jgi:menaquinone-dependent protoporphyrinogen oxidase